jgi:hypothetical protein
LIDQSDQGSRRNGFAWPAQSGKAGEDRLRLVESTGTTSRQLRACQRGAAR